ncbi:DUF4253 domain-containing protein [Streptomyces sp. IBSNAI002]|uniref:DUF4253 domain-containing protein n=1 Tax=Streptomyces sp. IBSNAI002 TaxID=3457500 RepID=UPI003FCFEA3F
MGTFLHRPRLTADQLVSALVARFPQAAVERSVTAAGVEVVGVSVERGRVREVWDEWRRRHGETGWWPYATSAAPGDEARCTATLGGGDRADLEDELARTVSQDHDAVVASVVTSGLRWSLAVACSDEEDRQGWLDDYDADRLAPLLGPALTEPLPGVSRWGSGDGDIFWGRSHRWLNFVPARGGHEVPVVLPHLIWTVNWSGYGDRVLTPADHAALLRRWHEQWGAELFFARGAYLELVVDRPPLTPGAAARAATELTGFCSDTVQDLPRAGDGMARSTMWSLWWD